MTIESQVCKKCSKEKPLSEYHNDKRTGNSKRTICIECRHIHRAAARIPKDEYLHLLEQQNNACAICGIDASELNRELSVDHNHETLQIRGLLCTYCNVGLGYFKDDTTLLSMAIEYLVIKDGIA
jgi:hypothetical protein